MKLKEMVNELRLADTKKTIQIGFDGNCYEIKTSKLGSFLVRVDVWIMAGSTPIKIVEDKSYLELLDKVERFFSELENKTGTCVVVYTEKGKRSGTVKYFNSFTLRGCDE